MSREEEMPGEMPGELPGELEDTDSYDLALEEEPEASEPLRRASTGKSLDISWRPSSRTVEETLTPGLSNEDLWLLIRRFNKQIYYVKAAPNARPKELDLNRTDNEQFPPEKLRMTLERFYTSVIVGFATLFNHVARLRSWNEFRRTSIFCSVCGFSVPDRLLRKLTVVKVYFVAWLFDILIPAMLGVLIALILFPPIRSMLFPPVPDADTSGGQKPTPGESMSHDSITGAPERHKGEAAEQEANDLVNSVAKVAMESAAGKYGQGVTEDAAPETPPATDSMQVVPATTDAPTGDTPAEDKTKQPMKAKVSKGTDQTMRVVSDITDIYEKFCNVLSPTPPFSTVAARLRLVGILISVCLASFLTSSYMVIKAIGFTVGFGFFGDPIFQWTLGFLNNKVPDWKKHLDLQQTLLKGVPTNAQLTLALLRLGEVHSSPLPPPPSLRDNEPSWPIPRKKSKAPGPGGDNAQGSSSSLNLQKQNSSTETLSGDKPKRKWVSKVFKFVRRTIATAIKSHIALDRAMAIAGSTQTQNLVGMLRKKGWVSAPYGPLKFDAKFERKRGAVVIDSSKEPPLLYFTTYQSSGLDDLQIESRKKGSVLFQIPVTDIRELKKTEGLGWKGKLIVELTAGSKDSADGLVISGTEPDQHYHITGMRGRNQLFNRLIAIDAQFWESY